MSIDILLENTNVIKPSTEFMNNTVYNDPSIYNSSNNNRLLFWEEQAHKVHWFKPWTNTLDWQKPYAKWFVGGKLNASYNCFWMYGFV